jgi:hypothetical protein
MLIPKGEKAIRRTEEKGVGKRKEARTVRYDYGILPLDRLIRDSPSEIES